MPSAVKPPRTLYDKVFEDHIVDEKDDGTILLYIGMSAAKAWECFLWLTGGRQASGPRSDVASKISV